MKARRVGQRAPDIRQIRAGGNFAPALNSRPFPPLASHFPLPASPFAFRGIHEVVRQSLVHRAGHHLSAPLVEPLKPAKSRRCSIANFSSAIPRSPVRKISPDGRYVSFLKPYKDTRNIWVKGVNDSYANAKLITNDTKRPVTNYFWSRDGKYIPVRPGPARRRELQRLRGRSGFLARYGAGGAHRPHLTAAKGVARSSTMCPGIIP